MKNTYQSRTRKPLLILFVLIITSIIMSSPGHSALTDDMIFYYSCDTADLNGSNPTDLVGNNQDAELVNGSSIVAGGRFNQACECDGVNDWIDLGDDPIETNISNNFTISFWMKPHNINVGNKMVITKSSGTVNPYYSYVVRQWVTNDGKLGFTSSSSAENDPGMISNDQNANQSWTHVIVRRVNNQMIMWMNNSNQSDVEAVDNNHMKTSSYTTQLCRYGGRTGSAPSGYWDGVIDEISMWKRGLNITEIAQVFALTSNPFDTNQPPTDPTISSPLNGSEFNYVYNQTINITWTASSDPNNDTFYYNLSLLNSDLTFNTSIDNDSIVLTHLFNYSGLIGNFTLSLSAYDNQSEYSNIDYINVTFINQTIYSKPLLLDLNISNFSATGSVYQEFSRTTLNITNAGEYILLSSFNLLKTQGAGTDEIYFKVFVDDVEQVEELVRTVTGATEGSTGISPINFSLAQGLHNVSFEISVQGVGVDIYSVNDIDMYLLNMVTDENHTISFTPYSMDYTFTNTTYADVFRFQGVKGVTSMSWILLNQKISKSTTGNDYVDFYLAETDDLTQTSPEFTRTLSGVIDIGAMLMSWFEEEENAEGHNHSVYARVESASTVTVNGTVYYFDLKDEDTHTINNFQTSNISTNITNDLTLTAGTHELARYEILTRNTTQLLLISSLSAESESGAQVITLIVNSTNVSLDCYSKKEDEFTASDLRRNTYLYTKCNSMNVDAYYNLTMYLKVETGETVTLHDESFSGIETGLFSTIPVNLPPLSGVITSPENNSNHNRLSDELLQINWTVFTDLEGDPVLYNVSILNSDQTHNQSVNQSLSILFETFNMSTLPLGLYAVQVEGCDDNDQCVTADLSYFTISENSPPNATVLTNPIPGSIYNITGESNINFTWIASVDPDSDPIEYTFHFLDNDSVIFNITSTSNTNLLYPVAGLNELIHYVIIQSCDNFTNCINSSIYNFTIFDNTAPSAGSFIFPVDGGSVNVLITHIYNVTWSGFTDPDSDTLLYNLTLYNSDDTYNQSFSMNLTTEYYQFNFSTLEVDSYYLLKLYAYDPDNYSSSVLEINFSIINTSVTSITIISPTVDEVVIGNLDYEFSLVVEGSAQCSLYDNNVLLSTQTVTDSFTFTLYNPLENTSFDFMHGDNVFNLRCESLNSSLRSFELLTYEEAKNRYISKYFMFWVMLSISIILFIIHIAKPSFLVAMIGLLFDGMNVAMQGLSNNRLEYMFFLIIGIGLVRFVFLVGYVLSNKN